MCYKLWPGVGRWVSWAGTTEPRQVLWTGAEAAWVPWAGTMHPVGQKRGRGGNNLQLPMASPLTLWEVSTESNKW